MSYWVNLIKNGEYMQVPPFNEGGIRVMELGENGSLREANTTEATVNVTWNYNHVYHEFLGDSLRGLLEGKRAGTTIEILTKGVQLLGTEQDPDYWKATKGNAGHILALLLSWAKIHPEAIWVVD